MPDSLEQWRQSLSSDGRRVPAFDPNDGGAAARMLILLETPGPGDGGPRMVSRDNPTGTARNLARFLDGAGIGRADTLLWNAVPWIVHPPGARNRALRRTEIAEGLRLLPPLLALLPRLRVVVLAGRVAAGASSTVAVARPEVAVLAMPHPSPTIVCTSPAIPARIRETLAEAASILASTRGPCGRQDGESRVDTAGQTDWRSRHGLSTRFGETVPFDPPTKLQRA